jgi:hypothetical protein
VPSRMADVLVTDTVAASRPVNLHTSIMYYIIDPAGNRLDPAGNRALRSLIAPVPGSAMEVPLTLSPPLTWTGWTPWNRVSHMGWYVKVQARTPSACSCRPRVKATACPSI